MSKKPKPLKQRLAALGLMTPEAAAPVLGVGTRSMWRYVTGETDPPDYVLRLVTMYELHGIPKEFNNV